MRHIPVFTLYFSAVLGVSFSAFAAGDSHGHAAKDASAGLPQFDPSSFAGQAFWLVVAFTILYVFFAKKTLPAISRVIDGRNEQVKGDISRAEDLRKQADEVQKNYEETLSKAKNQASKYYMNAETSLRKTTEKSQKNLQEKSTEQIHETEKLLLASKRKAMKEISFVAAEIASDAAQKIVGVSTDVKQAQTIVTELNKADRKAA